MIFVSKKKGVTLVRNVFFIIVIQCFITNPVKANQENEIDHDSLIQNAIVKIFTVTNSPDYFRPWMMMGPKNISGSGAIIEGERILTNAHVVADRTFIQVRRHGQARKYKARVLSISHESDLALLTVEDKVFFADVRPLALSELPDPQQEVLVYGFPLGGDSLSITKGILSRIEHQFYSHGMGHFLTGQIDAAINQGNSGGPVIVNGHIVGVVMQTLGPRYSENIGYMVPSPVISHFFKDISDGQHDGFPSMGLMTQTMENPGLKKQYKMSEQQTGVLVSHVFLNSPAQGVIQQGDIIISIDGHPIADNGSVLFRPKQRTNFKYYTDIRQLGDSVHLKILRRTAIKDLEIRLRQTDREFLLVQKQQYDVLPRYFIYGGYVFTPLTYNLVKRWGKKWQSKAPKELVMTLLDWPTEEKTEIVVVLQTLAADINKGYHGLQTWIVKTVNGKTFKDFNAFYRMVITSQEAFIILRNDKNFQVAIDRREENKSHQTILDIYRIGQDRSPDLRAIKNEPSSSRIP